MQLLCDMQAQFLWRSKQQPHEPFALELAQEDLGRVAEMGVDIVLHRALIAGLRPTALIVLTVNRVAERQDLNQVVRRATQNPRQPPVDQRHAPRLRWTDLHQRLDVRRVGDRHPTLHGLGERQGLEELERRTAEDRVRASTFRVAAVLEVVAEPVEIRSQLLQLLVRMLLGFDAARRLIEQRVHLAGPSRRRGEPFGVQVQVDAQDPRSVGAQTSEPAQLRFGDLVACGHVLL